MLDILLNWNRWGNNRLNSGHLRDLTERAIELLEMPETIVLTGLRRSGKTTILYQVMDHLEQSGISKKAMLYVNFEDPAFSQSLTLDLFDKVYRCYREEVYPKGKAFLFLDEVQAILGWERWVSTRNETEDIKIFISGSSAKLMSRELATLLTGRHIDLKTHPLSFREYLRFSDIEIPNAPLPYRAPPEIQAAQKAYMLWGGLPRVVLTQNENNKRSLLRDYLSDILFKDIALRHDIRNMNLLRSLAIYLFTQTACRITIKRLANIYSVSQTVVQNYCNYIEESFLITFIASHSNKVAQLARNPKKVHCHDLGFRNISNSAAMMEPGKLTETCVYNHLARQENDGIYYWQNKGEVDLILREGVDLTRFIQVVYDGLDNHKTFQREINALIEAHGKYPNAEKLLITARWPDTFATDVPPFIRIVPLWRYLLNV